MVKLLGRIWADFEFDVNSFIPNLQALEFWFVGFATLLFVSYSLLDIFLDRNRSKEKVLKLVFYLSIIFLGFFIPVLANFL